MGSVSHTAWAVHAESEWKACARRQAVKTAGWGPGPVQVSGETAAGTFGSGPGGPDGWGSCCGGGGRGRISSGTGLGLLSESP